MRVLIVNTSSHQGGAAIAANRLMHALCNEGVDAQMLTRSRKFPAFYWERFVIWAHNHFSRKNLFAVSIANSGEDITKTVAFRQADIIHLHWTSQGFLSLKGLQKIFNSGKPVVITMHDMWYCTGICHHAYTCNAYETECKNCRFLRIPSDHDLANRVFRTKYNIIRNARVNVVAVSTWLADKVRRSALLNAKPTTVIPNTISLSQFTMSDKAESRKALGLPDRNILVFGAAKLDDSIKGFGLLVDALKHMIETNENCKDELHLALFGNIKSDKDRFLAQIPIPYTYFGIIDASKLQSLYSASDVAVSSSYYETFGQTLIEAQACGCMPVSWGNSGQVDIINHKYNGYLADYLSVDSLADGIRWALTEGKETITREELRADVVSRFSEEIVAKEYINLYKQLLKDK